MTYPDQQVDYIVFPEPLICRFTRPVEAWTIDDDRFKLEFSKKPQEEAKGDLSASHHHSVREDLRKYMK